MHIDRYISVNRIVDLTSNDLTSAYSELLDTFTTLLPTPAKRKKVLKELVDREKSLTSYLGEGVALPHARVPMKRPNSEPQSERLLPGLMTVRQEGEPSSTNCLPMKLPRLRKRQNVQPFLFLPMFSHPVWLHG